MGRFQFDEFSQFTRVEAVMRAWYRHAVAEKCIPDSAAGLAEIFRVMGSTVPPSSPQAIAAAGVPFRFDSFQAVGIEVSDEEFIRRTAAFVHEFRTYIQTGALDASGKTLSPHYTESSGEPLNPRSSAALRLRFHDRYYPVHPHSHDYFELVILARGSCRHVIGRDFLRMHTGDVVIVPPNTTHWLIVDDDESVAFNLHLWASTFEQNFLLLLEQKNILSKFFRQALYAREDSRSYLLIRTGEYFLGDNALADLYSEMRSAHLYKEERLNTFCRLFFLDMLEQYSDRMTTSGMSEDAAGLSELMRYVQEQRGNVSMEELAERFNYSPRHLSRQISRYTGSTLRDIRRELRLKYATELLTGSTLSVEEISALCGYNNPTHFYTDFKSAYQKTPLAYRKSVGSIA